MVALVRLGPGGGKDLEPCLGEAGGRWNPVDGTGVPENFGLGFSSYEKFGFSKFKPEIYHEKNNI